MDKMHRIIENKIRELKDICESFGVKRLYVFGSISTAKFDEKYSDIDLIVELNEKDPVEKGEKLIILWDKFEELFGRKVDLLSKTPVRNPYLQKGIEATKQLIYEA
jgi:predicted nucleotidyltransferase